MLREEWIAFVNREGENVTYPLAAAVARFLLDELGWEGLLQLGEEARRARSEAAVVQAIEKAFNRSAAEVDQAFLTSERYPSESRWWVLPSLAKRIELGETADLHSLTHPALEIEHVESERTLLEVEG